MEKNKGVIPIVVRRKVSKLRESGDATYYIVRLPKDLERLWEVLRQSRRKIEIIINVPADILMKATLK